MQEVPGPTPAPIAAPAAPPARQGPKKKGKSSATEVEYFGEYNVLALSRECVQNKSREERYGRTESADLGGKDGMYREQCDTTWEAAMHVGARR